MELTFYLTSVAFVRYHVCYVRWLVGHPNKKLYAQAQEKMAAKEGKKLFCVVAQTSFHRINFRIWQLNLHGKVEVFQQTLTIFCLK